MKFLDLLKRVKAMLEEVPEKHTGEVTMKFQLPRSRWSLEQMARQYGWI